MSDVSESAHVRLMLADYASVDPQGKLNIIGGSITVLGLDAAGGVTAPHAIIAVVTFAPEFIGETPAVELALERDDGSLVILPGPGGLEPQFLRVGAADTLKSAVVSVPGVIVPLDAIRPRAQFVMYFANGLPLPPGRKYTGRVGVDHETRDEWTETFLIPALDAGPVVG